MNVLGKIFVIANLIFSVVTAALIMVVYTTRTNWHQNYVDMDKQARVAKANAEAYWELVQKMREEEDKKVKARDNDLTSVRNELKQEQERAKGLEAQLGERTAAYGKIVQDNK